MRKLFLSRGSDRGSGGRGVSCRAQVSLVARQRKCLSRCASQSCRVFDVPLAARKLVLSRGRCVSCRARVSRAGQVSLVLHKLVLSRGSGRASCPVQVSLVARHRCLLSCARYSCRAAATAAAAEDVSFAARKLVLSRAAQVSLAMRKLVLSSGSGSVSRGAPVSLVAWRTCLLLRAS